jgi:hypothetical protein
VEVRILPVPHHSGRDHETQRHTQLPQKSILNWLVTNTWYFYSQNCSQINKPCDKGDNYKKIMQYI